MNNVAPFANARGVVTPGGSAPLRPSFVKQLKQQNAMTPLVQKANIFASGQISSRRPSSGASGLSSPRLAASRIASPYTSSHEDYLRNMDR